MRESRQGVSFIFAVAGLIMLLTVVGVYVFTITIVEDHQQATGEPEGEDRIAPTNTLRFGTPVRTLPPGLQPFAPGSGSAPTPAPVGATTVGCQVRADWASYTVQDGDTFGTIAAAYGLTIEELNAGNCLSNPDSIVVGQVLRVPPG